MKGKIKFFDSTKGFGFIAADDGKEIFVHQTALDEGVTLEEGDSVTFDVEQGDRGPKAVNVKKGTEEEATEEEATEDVSDDDQE
jgi:cold shock protein